MGGTICVPCRHGYEMWHWPGSCSAWPHGGGGNSSSVSLTFSATSGLPERRHLLLVEGEGKSEFTVVLLCKVPVSPWLLPSSNPFKSRRGDRRDTGVGVVSLGRLAVKVPRDLQGLARKISLLLMLWPESPEESQGWLEKLKPATVRSKRCGHVAKRKRTLVSYWAGLRKAQFFGQLEGSEEWDPASAWKSLEQDCLPHSGSTVRSSRGQTPAPPKIQT